MRNLARNDSRSAEVQRVAFTLGNPWQLDVWLRSVWEIVPDPEDAEFVRAPVFTLRCGLQGDCDDAATLVASILRAMHWPSLLVAVRMPVDKDFSHVFTRVPGIDLDIDPIVPMEHMPIRYAEAMVMPV